MNRRKFIQGATAAVAAAAVMPTLAVGLPPATVCDLYIGATNTGIQLAAYGNQYSRIRFYADRVEFCQPPDCGGAA